MTHPDHAQQPAAPGEEARDDALIKANELMEGNFVGALPLLRDRVAAALRTAREEARAPLLDIIKRVCRDLEHKDLPVLLWQDMDFQLRGQPRERAESPKVSSSKSQKESL
jgi:hypothetical protein